MKIYFSITIHIIILSRCPCQAYSRSKTIINTGQLVQYLLINVRWHGRLLGFSSGRSRGIYHRSLTFRRIPTSVHGEIQIQCQTIDNLPTMSHGEIKILIIIQPKPAHIKNTVRNILQFIQYGTTINTITVTKLHIQRSPFTRIIIKTRPHLPVKFFLFKVITCSRGNLQTPIT